MKSEKKYSEKGDIKCCENPFDVFDFYPIIDDDCNFNRFCKVEGSGKADKEEEKTAFSKLKVKAEIGIKGFISAFIEIVKESVKTEKSDSDGSKLASSGDGSQLASSGNSSKLASSGKDSVICCIGINSKAKAKKGSWITLAEWELKDGKYFPKCVKTEFVDGERILADVWYMLKDGEFTECEE